MRVVLNGEPREIADGLNLRALLDASPYAQRRVAVEINREIVPRSQHADRVLREGDRIEIVQAMGGG